MKKETADALLTLSEQEYDAMAGEFSRTRRFFWRELEFLKTYAHPGDRVLDVGCGNGRLLDLLEAMPVDYTGVDVSRELIAISHEQRGARGTFMQASALSLPFEDSSFDVVYSVAVLHHIPSHAYRRRFMEEINRVLKPGGTCVLTVWNIIQWKFAYAHLVQTVKKVCGLSPLDLGDVMLSFGNDKRKRYVHALRERELRHLFEASGLTCTSIKNVVRQSGYANVVAIGARSPACEHSTRS